LIIAVSVTFDLVFNYAAILFECFLLQKIPRFTKACIAFLLDNPSPTPSPSSAEAFRRPIKKPSATTFAVAYDSSSPGSQPFSF